MSTGWCTPGEKVAPPIQKLVLSNQVGVIVGREDTDMLVLSLILVFEVQTEHRQGFTELCILTISYFMLFYALRKQARAPGKAA